MIWTPDTLPPKVDPEAGQSVQLKLLEHGLNDVVAFGMEQIEANQKLLAEYIDRFGFLLNDATADSPQPRETLRSGAAIAYLAYQETEYPPIVDHAALSIGNELAIAQGIPESFVASYYSDDGLRYILETAQVMPDYRAVRVGNHHVSTIGAGVVRHFIQQSFAA